MEEEKGLEGFRGKDSGKGKTCPNILRPSSPSFVVIVGLPERVTNPPTFFFL